MYNQSFECKSWFYHDKPQLRDGQELLLQREPDNQYDQNAVEVFTKNGLKVGYIPADMSPDISKRLKGGEAFYIFVMNPYDEELETAPWLHVQDMESRLACEASERKHEEFSAKANTVTTIVLLIFILLGLGSCVAIML